ncbi:MAG: alkaline phosphatase family protein [Calditrichaeota bacterium]|nr:alkaline phosphatase family protein [Calditrichota bacterium]
MKLKHHFFGAKFVWILFFIFLSTLPALPVQNTLQKPYLILISFDGFRWDYVQRKITPNLNFMAKNGVAALSLEPVFPSKTFPNHLSIVTGMYPTHHGIIRNDFLDPFSRQRYKVGDTKSVRNAYWYQGEAFWETAERQGIISASYFWPGSELTLEYRRPTFFEFYDGKRSYEERVNGVIRWLQLPEKQRPHFITLYFEATDNQGHRHGPDSPEVNEAIQKLDKTLGLLFERLKEIDLFDKTNIIVVSDHGMTATPGDQIINVNNLVKNCKFKSQGTGPLMMIDADDENINQIYDQLASQENHFQVFRREQMPEYFHFSRHPFISPIILVAEPGWTLVNRTLEKIGYRLLSKGNHGYDNHFLDMHGIFFAMGPAFKKNYRTGTLRNIDIYPLLCKIFNIFPRENIDGKLERIEFILK